VAASKSFEAVIRERRATMHFDGAPLPDAALQTILEHAGQAPSGYNLQPWRFLVVRTPDAKARLRKAAFDQPKITEASAVVVAFAPREGWKENAAEIFEESARRGAIPPAEKEKRLAGAIKFIESMDRAVWLNRHTMIAFTHLMLAAEAAGFDTAPMEGFDPAAVRTAMELPGDCEVVALLAIGRLKGEDKPNPGRLPLSRLAFSESLRQPWGA
jgi:nitroreductase